MSVEEAPKATTSRPVSRPWLWILAVPFAFFMFFYLGWVYQANWYWYYGIDPAQLDVPLAPLLQQSTIMSLLVLGILLLIFGVLFLLRLIVLYVRNAFFGERRAELASLFSIRDLVRHNLHLAALIYLGLIHQFLVEVAAHNRNWPDLQMPASVVMLDVFLIPAAAILFIRLLGDFIDLLPMNLKRRLRLGSNSRIHDEPYRMILSVLAIYAVSVMFIGVMGVGDASVGFRENASYQAVRRVYLESYAPIAGLEPYRQGCDCNPYIYGPLVYLGSNEEHLFLIPWKGDDQIYFPQFPRLYQIEHSQNSINVIPYEFSP